MRSRRWTHGCRGSAWVIIIAEGTPASRQGNGGLQAVQSRIAAGDRMSTGSRQEKAALEAAIDRVTRLAKELRTPDLAGIQERWDPRTEALQKRVNNALGDVLGHGSPEYKQLKIDALDGSLDTSFGDRYSSEELHECIRKGLDGAISALNAARDILAQRLQGGMPAPAAKAAEPAKPAPTAAPTPAPTQAPAPAATPT